MSKEAGGETFLPDFNPTGIIDAKREHVLFAGIEAGRAIEPWRGRREIRSNITDCLKDFRIKEPGICRGGLWRDVVAASLPSESSAWATSKGSGSQDGLLSKVGRLFG